MEKFVGAIEKQRQEAKDMANLEVQLKEKKQALNEIERNSRLKQLEFDRRLTELQTHHARNVQYLLKQVETVSSDPLLKRCVLPCLITRYVNLEGVGSSNIALSFLVSS